MTMQLPIGGGFFIFFQTLPPDPPAPPPKGLHGGRPARRQPWTEHDGDWYPKKKEPVVDPDKQARIDRIMREDQEILDFIVEFLTKGPAE